VAGVGVAVSVAGVGVAVSVVGVGVAVSVVGVGVGVGVLARGARRLSGGTAGVVPDRSGTGGRSAG
jgi:hypothetical protein